MNTDHKLMMYIHLRLPDAKHPCLQREIKMLTKWPHGAIVSRKLKEMWVWNPKKHKDRKHQFWRIICLEMAVEVWERIWLPKKKMVCEKRTIKNLEYHTLRDRQRIRNLQGKRKKRWREGWASDWLRWPTCITLQATLNYLMVSKR